MHDPLPATPPDTAQAPARPLRAYGARWAIKWGLAVWALILLCSLAAWLCLQMGVDPHTLDTLHGSLSQLRPWFWLAHLVVFGLLAWRWQALVAWGQRRGIVKDFEIDQVLALRNRALAFFAAYILLVAIGPRNLMGLWA